MQDHEDESKTFPIIVWIHGGSFLAGSADTGIDMEVSSEFSYYRLVCALGAVPFSLDLLHQKGSVQTVARNIIFKGITFVTINYRLGPLGEQTFAFLPNFFRDKHYNRSDATIRTTSFSIHSSVTTSLLK